MPKSFTDWKKQIKSLMSEKIQTCEGMKNTFEETVVLRVPIKHGGGLVSIESKVKISGHEAIITGDADDLGLASSFVYNYGNLPREVYSSNARILSDAVDRISERADGLLKILRMQENAFIAREIPDLAMQRIKGNTNIETDPTAILKNRCFQVLRSCARPFNTLDLQFVAKIEFPWLVGPLEVRQAGYEMNLGVMEYPKNYMEVLANRQILSSSVKALVQGFKATMEEVKTIGGSSGK